VSESEGQLVSRAASGDSAAWRELYDAHAGCVVAYLLRSGFARGDADDLTQDTFLRALRSLRTFDPARGAFGAWLGAIARNVARKHWGRRAQPDNFDPDLAADVLADPADGPNPGPAQAARREEMDAVADCIARLPEELARLVRLRYVEGRTTRGVAEAAGTPEATVRVRLAEAHNRLRQCLKSKGVME
jgi:RNA polymerase sigma-70 factor (ECF subfamily)